MSRPIGFSFFLVISVLIVGCGGRTQYEWAECGNDDAELGEECDGVDLRGGSCIDLGWSGGSLSCNDRCTYDTSDCSGTGPQCGNGVREYGEQCDLADLDGQSCVSLGHEGGPLGCSASCSFDVSQCGQTSCGNGVVDGLEECDGLNLSGLTCQDLDYDGGVLACATSCTFDESGCYVGVPHCGDGVVNAAGEQCDDADIGQQTCESLGLPSGTLACTASCTYDVSLCIGTAPVCGDGVATTPQEQCDGLDLRGRSCQSFGWDNGSLVCTVNCQYDVSQCYFIQQQCGDGVVNTPSEQCDGADMQGMTCQALGYDGGTLACASNCAFDTSQCTVTQPYCGDSVVNMPSEQCDGADMQGMNCQALGYDGGTLGCTGGCWFDESQCFTTQPYCGDGVVNTAWEECDGADMQGETCQSQGFPAGTLVCTGGCLFDTTGCSGTASCSPTGGSAYCDTGALGTTVGSPSLVSAWTACGVSNLTGPETVYQFSLPAGSAAKPVWVGLYQLTASLDAVVLRAGNNGCDPAAQCELVLDNPGTQDEGGDFYAFPGVTYYIIIDGNAGVSGDYVLAIGCF